MLDVVQTEQPAVSPDIIETVESVKFFIVLQTKPHMSDMELSSDDSSSEYMPSDSSADSLDVESEHSAYESSRRKPRSPATRLVSTVSECVTNVDGNLENVEHVANVFVSRTNNVSGIRK